MRDSCQQMAEDGEFGQSGDCTTDPTDYDAACLVITNNDEDLEAGAGWLANHNRRDKEPITVLGYS